MIKNFRVTIHTHVNTGVPGVQIVPEQQLKEVVPSKQVPPEFTHDVVAEDVGDTRQWPAVALMGKQS